METMTNRQIRMQYNFDDGVIQRAIKAGLLVPRTGHDDKFAQYERPAVEEWIQTHHPTHWKETKKEPVPTGTVRVPANTAVYRANTSGGWDDYTGLTRVPVDVCLQPGDFAVYTEAQAIGVVQAFYVTATSGIVRVEGNFHMQEERGRDRASIEARRSMGRL